MGVNERSKIAMSDEEIEQFLAERRTITMATIGADGLPHMVAMWFGIVDGAICFETKAKSQKAVNLMRDPRITCLVEDGDTYDKLRGVSFEGTAEVIDDADYLMQVGISVWERYYGPYTEELKPMVEMMLNKRVAVKVNVERTRSWDHRKLGIPDNGAPGGTTAPAARTYQP
jgi:PPOX class probable F420-dependent enzyme